ncbi:MAG: hypothetical protein RLZZ74_3083, partial [Cyanobacteriota bacterium]
IAKAMKKIIPRAIALLNVKISPAVGIYCGISRPVRRNILCCHRTCQKQVAQPPATDGNPDGKY